MTDEREAPGLLARDRERLDRVARAVREDRRGFFTLVCGEELLPAALAYLRQKSEREVPEPLQMRDSEAIVDCLRSVGGAPRSHLSCISIDAESEEVWRSLNWHREKLVEGGRVILWLFSVEALQAFRKHAPDAYSYREAVLVLEGEWKSLPEGDWEEGEPQEIRVARVMWELGRTPEERAEAGYRLVKVLFARNRFQEAAAVAEQALDLISGDKYKLVREATTRIKLYDFLRGIHLSRDRNIDAYRVCQAAIAEIGHDLAERFREHLIGAELVLSSSAPLAADRASLHIAQQRTTPESSEVLQYILSIALSSSLQFRGRFEGALRALDGRLMKDMHDISARAFVYELSATVCMQAGRFKMAQQAFAAEGALRRRVPLPGNHSGETVLLLAQGELAAAAKLDPDCVYHGAIIQLKKGNVADIFDVVGEAIDDYLGHKQDKLVFDECIRFANLLAVARSADALSNDELDRALKIIATAGRSLIEYANKNPPWYDVLFPGLRAEILSLFGTRHQEAIKVATESVALARSLWKQALPRSTRILVECLARAGQWNRMAKPIIEAMACARDEDHLIELSKVQAYDLARRLQRNASQDLIDGALDVLRKTFAEMDAPRVEGETWLKVAPYIPPTTTSIDLIEIVDHIHDLFSDMPMPENAARCMEWLGDIYAARGDKKQAERCYRMALSQLERFGLLLRKPLLQKKLGAI